ncbi:MAG: plasmid stabilization protein [Leeuwenhoekiella sp.]
MKIKYLRSFSKDLRKIKNKKVKTALKSSIQDMKQAESLEQIGHLKKLKGHPFAYRIRLGSYRLGFLYKDDILTLARFVKREDIYKLFP